MRGEYFRDEGYMGQAKGMSEGGRVRWGVREWEGKMKKWEWEGGK